MTPAQATQRGRQLLAAVGGLDLASGLGLVLVPQVLLPLAGLVAPAGEGLVYCRFLGTMVAAVGACCWLALRGATMLRAGLALTCAFRAGAGLFVTAALMLGWLQWPWVVVAGADFVLWAAQVVLLRAGAGA